MPTAVSPNHRAGASAPDDLDNLLDYDNAVQDFWRDLPDANNASNNNDTTAQPTKDIDEEVKLTKKRKPNPKLDDARLLSDAGIPKLRRIAKDRVKFKGKGHEFSDISRMLNLYQLWLDDLYPKAKFRDGLAMVEKLGHSKRMQVSRRAWMDESKALRRREDEEMLDAEASARRDDADDAIFGQQTEQQQAPPEKSGEAPEDDELDAMFAEESSKAPQAATGAPPARNGPFGDDNEGPDDDELDALMAESAAPATTMPTASVPLRQKGPFDEDDESDQDELDALLSEEQPQESSTGVHPAAPVPQNTSAQDDFAAEEEAMAEMGDFW